MSVITAMNLTKGGGSSVSSLATNAFTTTLKDITFIAVSSFILGGTTPNTPTISGWTQVKTSGDANGRITVFANVLANTGAVTIDFGGQTQHDINYIVDKLSVVLAVINAGIVQSNTNSGSGSSGSVSLSALQNINNVTYGACYISAGGLSITAGAGFTQLEEENFISSTVLQTEYGFNQTNATWTFSGSASWKAIAIEVKQALLFGGAII